MSTRGAGPTVTYLPPPAAPVDPDGGPDLVARCRAALARWVTVAGEQLRALTPEETARAAAERYAARPPRPASSDAAVLLPGMRRATWFRTARLVEERAVKEFGRARPGPRAAAPVPLARVDQAAEQDAAAAWRRAFTTRAVRQMIAILGDECGADTAGRIPNTGAFLARYRKAVRCSESAAYEHWKAVRELGLVRQTRHSAGHRPDDGQGQSTTHARYVLTWPAALLPESLPAAADALTAEPLAPQAAAWHENADHVAHDAGAEGLYRYGSCRTTETLATTPETTEDDLPQNAVTGVSTYYLEAWPLYARVSPPTPTRASSRSGDRPLSARSGGISDDERAAAARLLDRCRPLWARQGQNLTEEESRQVSPLIAIALRYTATLGAQDLVELLSERVQSARCLGRVLLRRLQALINSLRRLCAVQADDDGARYDRETAQRAAKAVEAYAATVDSRAATRAELEATRARLAERQAALKAEQSAAVRPVRSYLVEDEAVFAAELAAQVGYLPASAPGPLSGAHKAALRRAVHQRTR